MLFLRNHLKLQKIKIECIPVLSVQTLYGNLPAAPEETLLDEGRGITELALNCFNVRIGTAIRLTERHGKTLRNLAFVSSDLAMENSYARIGPDCAANFALLKQHLVSQAPGLISFQIFRAKNLLLPPLARGTAYLITPTKFRRLYRDSSRNRMRELVENLPELRFAADWKSLAWFILRDRYGKREVNDLVPVDKVAWKLETDEMEERALDRSFSWNGRFSSRIPLSAEANWIKPRGTTHM
ncbi:hypothetical protein L873DRAFT_839070 [Choiromyces venosus 120613-1]|uniref:Uncharacterized protein n=1 Tax=Choiromyces venosus 120613-1 TaxID=1336337 RepID=A0A3N4JPJ9_9PEZI|nr:hypothetical protein L873DRAFT_839070 [Choiromyces venosus 120613-1]